LILTEVDVGGDFVILIASIPLHGAEIDKPSPNHGFIVRRIVGGDQIDLFVLPFEVPATSWKGAHTVWRLLVISTFAPYNNPGCQKFPRSFQEVLATELAGHHRGQDKATRRR
jgi:hypothetical protein